ncbi:MAG TPA: T9SS type A sorting domain-containing protein, partial [Candidatus Kapabacteria bacterium]|nr:T9SS type A sorting domain-containing protein [Candidatus Kapabacteria bacterium]
DSLYFLVAAQQVPNPSTVQYTMEPSWVFSQAAANILHVIKQNPKIAASVAGFKTLTCDSVTYSGVTINNTGTDTLQIDSVIITQNNEGFSLVPLPSVPIIIPPGKDTILTIQFEPASPGSKTAMLEVKSDAANTPVLMLPLSGVKNNAGAITATITMTADSGKPGDTVLIPVIAQSQPQISLSGIGYTARVSYNGSILLPIGIRNGVIDSIGNGVVVFSTINAADTVTLIFIVGLGDAPGTTIQVDTIGWGGCSVQSTSINGVFQLTGLCTQGGTRLFTANGQLGLSQNNPNPFNTETEIIYSTIEDGETELYVTDVLGRRVETLASGYKKAGKYTAVLNGGGLQSGIYYYALQTPTEILRKTMILEK